MNAFRNIVLLIAILLWSCGTPKNQGDFVEVAEAGTKDTTQIKSSDSKRSSGKAKNKVSVQLLHKLFKKTGFVSLPYEVDNNSIHNGEASYKLLYDADVEPELVESGFRYVIAVLPDTTNYYLILRNIPAGNGILEMIVYSKDGEELFSDSFLENYCDELGGNQIECSDKLTIHEDLSMTYHHHSIWEWERYGETTKTFYDDTVCAQKNARGFIDSNGQVVFEKVKMDTIDCNNLYNNRRSQ